MTIPDSGAHLPPNTPPSTGAPSSQPSSSAGSSGANQNQASIMDPAGIWQKFLSRSGTQATPEDVQQFFRTLFKTFNTLIQQSDAAAQRAAEYTQKVISGEE